MSVGCEETGRGALSRQIHAMQHERSRRRQLLHVRSRRVGWHTKRALCPPLQ